MAKKDFKKVGDGQEYIKLTFPAEKTLSEVAVATNSDPIPIPLTATRLVIMIDYDVADTLAVFRVGLKDGVFDKVAWSEQIFPANTGIGDGEGPERFAGETIVIETLGAEEAILRLDAVPSPVTNVSAWAIAV